MLRKIQPQFNTLEDVKNYIESKDDSLECSIQIDQWVETIIKASNKCFVIKKTSTAGAKVVMPEPNVVNVERIIPSHFFNNFRRGIFSVVLEMVTSSAQNQLASQVDGYLKEIEN